MVRIDKMDKYKFSFGANWAEMDDRCIVKFFSFYKAKRIKTKIKQLVEDGKSLRSQEEIANYIQIFYKNLFTNDLIIEANQIARDECFISISIVAMQE